MTPLQTLPKGGVNLTTEIPSCLKCGSAMRWRQPTGRRGFYSCVNFPRCRGTLDYAPPSASVGVTGTEQQEEFWREMLKGKSHIVLKARAGCGKSFSIVQAAKLALEKWPQLRVTFCAFNKDIAEELKGKVPRGCVAKTTHALGFQAIRDVTFGKTKMDDDKVRTLLKERLNPDEFIKGRPNKALVRAVKELVSQCKNYLYDGTPEQLDELVERHDITIRPNQSSLEMGRLSPREAEEDERFKTRVYSLVPRLLEACKESLASVDHDDMMWLPVVLNLTVPQCDLLFADECQDWNRCQQELALRMCPKGRIVIVGDDRQAIYAFRGADAQSMERMGEILSASRRGCVELPLTFTRRCPKSHVALAQRLVPDIEALPDAPEGLVESLDADDLAQAALPHEMILCRTNAPLVNMAHKFLRAEKKAVLRGKDLSGPIRDLIDGLGGLTVQELGERLSTYRLAEVARLEAADKAATVISDFEDKCATLEVLMEGCVAIAEIHDKITRIFEIKDPDGAIILSSIHGSKGLEADTIYILRPDLMPHPAALKKGKPDDLAQEANMEYVALTRSKNRLVFVQPKSKTTHSVVEDESDEDEDIFESEKDEIEVKAESDDATDPDPLLLAALDWREKARRHLIEVNKGLPFDAPAELVDAVQLALEAIPRA